MLQVVCRVRSNLHVAYLNSEIEASRVALSAKLPNLESNTVRELLHYSATDCAAILKEMNGTNPALLPGDRRLCLDGNCLAATEHRLKVLRNTKAGALPGKSLVLFDQELGLAVDVIPGETGHAQERSLWTAVLDIVKPNELLVADRNFGVLSFLFGIVVKGGFFIIRQLQYTPVNSLSPCVFMCHTKDGKVFDESVFLLYEGLVLKVRRRLVKLIQPTSNDERVLAFFSYFPPTVVSAPQIAELFQLRWGIETAFQ